MGLTNSGEIRNKIHKLVRDYIDDIKILTKSNLNSEAVNAEGFFRNYLNLLYDFNLTKEKIESITNDTIDLHNPESKICVQVSATNTKAKFKKTVEGFKKKEKNKLYSKLIFLILDRNVSFNINGNELSELGVEIEIIDYSKLYQRLQIHFDSYELIIPVYNFVISELKKDYTKADILESQVDFEELVELPKDFEKLHIVEKIHSTLSQFSGLNSLHPELIVNLPPFKNGKSSTTSYSNFCLKTDNKEIHNLLEQIKVENFEVDILEPSLEIYKDKIESIFSILNHSLIRCICYREKYTEIEHHSIRFEKNDKNCDCYYCLYNRFEITQLNDTLKQKSIVHSEDLDEAIAEGYFLCKLGYHIKGWSIFESVRTKTVTSENSIRNFLSQLNIRAIKGFINAPWNGTEKNVILPKIESIDIYPSIVKYTIPKVVRNELIKIKEDYYLNRSRRKVLKLVTSISDTKLLYINGGTTIGPDYVTQLYNELFTLYAFYIANHIVIDDFNDFKSIFSTGIKGFFKSYTTKESYGSKLNFFDFQIISWIIKYMTTNELEETIQDNNIKIIKLGESAKQKLLDFVLNFFKFQYRKGVLNSFSFNSELTKQDYFSLFRKNLRKYYDRIMCILAIVDIEDDMLKECNTELINFIKASEDFNSNNWKYTSLYIEKKTSSFDVNNLKELIHLTMNGKNHRAGEDVIEDICYSISGNTNYKFDDSFLFGLIDNLVKPCDKCNQIHKEELILAPWVISNSNAKEKIKTNILEMLNKEFDVNLFEEAVFAEVLTKEDASLVKKYIEYSIKSCKAYDLIDEDGETRIRDFRGHNCINCLAELNVQLSEEEINKISKVSKYYEWLISPQEYDYDNFNYYWLLNACPSLVREKLKGISKLEIFIKKELKANHSTKLSRFYFKYLAT